MPAEDQRYAVYGRKVQLSLRRAGGPSAATVRKAQDIHDRFIDIYKRKPFFKQKATVQSRLTLESLQGGPRRERSLACKS